MRKAPVAGVLLVSVISLAAFLATDTLNSDNPKDKGFACEGERVQAGEDLAGVVNNAPPGTTFCIEAGDYPLTSTVEVQDGDVLKGEPGKNKSRGPAVDPDPVVHVRNVAGLPRMFHVTAESGRMEWLDIEGDASGARYTGDTRATCDNWGEFSGRCPADGTGLGIGAGESGPGFIFDHLQIHHHPSNCIGGVRGRLLRSELFHCSENADYWGYSAGALKTIYESESAFNFVHDNEAVGLWCDQGCHDNPTMPNGWHQHDNLVVDNGRAGIRYEFSPMVGNGVHLRQPTALIEENLLAGNGRGAIEVEDAQNVTVRNNTMGALTVAGIHYSHNGTWPEAMQFSDGGTPRTDLWNVEAYSNSLGGEAANGCGGTADPNKVYCHDNEP